jgi:outer membrane protein assembly factor BamB
MTGRVFASDNRGSVFMVSLEGQSQDGEMKALAPGAWDIRTVATLQENIASASDSDPGNVRHYSTPYGLCVGLENGKIWLGGGTSNVMVKKSQSAASGELENDFQMVFGFRVPEAGAAILARGDLKALDDTADTKLEPGDSRPGWYIKLRPGGQGTGEEYVSAKPLLVGGRMYVATFRETKRVDTGKAASLCGATRSVSGEGRLYAVDIKTGEAARWTGDMLDPVKYIAFNDAKIVDLGLMQTNDAYFVTTAVDILSDSSDFEAVVNAQQDSKQRDENSSENKEGKAGGRGGIPSKKTIILYWLEK